MSVTHTSLSNTDKAFNMVELSKWFRTGVQFYTTIIQST